MESANEIFASRQRRLFQRGGLLSLTAGSFSLIKQRTDCLNPSSVATRRIGICAILRGLKPTAKGSRRYATKKARQPMPRNKARQAKKDVNNNKNKFSSSP